ANRKPLTAAELNLMDKILDRIGREGPLMVKDFDNDRQEASSGWWDWRPAKLALERLYLDGRLMVTRGKDFHKVYDLPRNLVPEDVDRTMPTPEEFARHVIRRELRVLGIAYVGALAWRATFVKGHVIRQEIVKMAEEGEVCIVTVEGVKTGPLYMLPSYKNKKIGLRNDVLILSPWDIVNVYRHRLRDFFDFDYQIECFVPAPKRKYGYFSLPILSGEKFIARMDAKADRKQKLLIIHNLHFKEVDIDEKTIDKFVDALKDYIIFNKCRDITFKKSNNSDLLAII